MDAGLAVGIAIVAVSLTAMTAIVLSGRSIIERFHREGARPFVRGRRAHRG